MYTTRGYRQHSKENRKKSEYGQIIQKRPTFQIDNNPVVLDAYKKFIYSTMPRLLRTQLDTSTHEITLSDFSLSWNSSNRLPAVMEALSSFAAIIFNQYKELGRYPISLELYAPNLNQDIEWLQQNNGSRKLVLKFDRIIIDCKGNISWIQQNGVQSDYITYASNAAFDISDMILCFGPLDSTTYSNPTKMLMDVNYFTFYNGN